MPVLSSAIDPRSATFRANADAMAAKLGKVRELEERVRLNSASRQATFSARNQILPRERIERLLDRGAPFLEISSLAGYKMHDDDGAKNIMGGGSIAGIGMVAGKRVIVTANDSGIKGGTIPPMGLKKALRLQDIALENRLPLIALVESGGANLLYQSEMFVEGGRSFANQARLSAAGIPQIAIVHGSSTAGGAYLPGLSDYVVLVRGRSKIFLAGPPLVKAAIGEDASDEELGGADVHGRVTGLGEYVAEDDLQALAYGR
jgi:geranyl-CoA carboxylase beta subunit